MKQMHLVGFLHSSQSMHSHALWRHPRTHDGFLQPELYQSIARALERGKFDLVFFADTLSVPDAHGGSSELSIKYGAQGAARPDPLLIAATMATSGERLGLGVTRSCSFYHPFDVARSFATLDHLTRGRAAWNVVTSNSDAEAQNFGLDKHLEHDARYDRADEFMEVVFKLWNSWEDGAVVADKESGVFADPAKVRYINHDGRWFKSRGPLNVPRCPQGRPVIIQAGSSERGKEFAARWAEVVFTTPHEPALMKEFYVSLKSLLPKYGRAPEGCKVFPAFMPFVGETEAAAREKQAYHNGLVHPLAGLAALSRSLGCDLSGHPLDEPLGDLQYRQGGKSMYERVMRLSGERGMTLGELAQRFGQSRLVPQVAGSPSQVSDYMESVFVEGACDGFIISPTCVPGAFEDFVDFVVPELQRRDLFRREYKGRTLREHLGLG